MTESDLDNAEKAAGLNRTISRQEKARTNFLKAFAFMETKAKAQEKLDTQLYGSYSAITMGLSPDRWEDRFSHSRNIRIANHIFEEFYKKLDGKEKLTLEKLAWLYDQLGIHELLLDGNGRALVLAISHILISQNYPPPDMTKVTPETMKGLARKYTNPLERNTELLKMVLPEGNRPPIR